MSSLEYQQAHLPSHSKDNVQKYEFDSPHTIAKQHQFQQAGGPQLSGIPQAPPLPQSRAFPLNRKQLNLKTRDWNNKPWSSGKGWQGESYAAPSNLSKPSNLGMVRSSSSSGLPSTNYTPLSTIPLHHDYHLPSSGLSHSSGPFDAPLTKKYDDQGFNAQLNKDYLPSSSSSSGLSSNIPVPPPLPNWSRKNNFNAPLTKNYADQSLNAQLQKRALAPSSGLNSSSSGFSSNIPVPPPLPNWNRNNNWNSQRGVWGSQKGLRTRNWGLRNEDGWSNFNRGIFIHDSALPFNANRSLRWSESTTTQTFQQPITQTFQQPITQTFQQPITQTFTSAPISSVPLSAAPISLAPISAAPIAATPLAAPLSGRKGRRAAKRALKQQAIAEKLTTQITPPIGDPALNHYRRGAKATVPLAGPAIAGLAPPTGSVASRRVGKKNTLGRRRNRTAAPGLPVPATQPPFVAPLAGAPLSSGTILGQQSFSSVPLTSVPLSSAPLSSVPLSAAPVTVAPLAAAPLSQAPLAPLAAPLGRRGRRSARRALKQQAIADKLTTQITPPIGDPALNHYRRGAKATVPLAGPAIAGLAPPTGSVASRRVGKKNTLGRRRNRTAAPGLPVPATQPPFVAPLATTSQFPAATYRTLHSNPSFPSSTSYVVQPQSAFIPASSTMTAAPLSSSFTLQQQPTFIPASSLSSSYGTTSAIPFSSSVISSSAGIPLSSTAQPLYSSTSQQVRPLSSTLTNAQGSISQAPIYSAKEPVAAQLLQKQSQAPIISTRPTGSATF